MTSPLTFFLALLTAGTLAMLAAVGANALLDPPQPRAESAVAARDQLSKALAAKKLADARHHINKARWHVRRLERDAACN